MDYNNNDIIIAQATPVGKSALGIIRITGVDLSLLFQKIINKKIFKPKFSYLTKLLSFNGKRVLDECMAIFYKGPNSFNGDDVIELTCHGNIYIIEKIIGDFNENGVRMALPGEFSYRAFRNKKLDLMQTESIMEKINAGSLSFSKMVDNMASGETSRKLQKIQKKILNIKTIIEHELDFNEEEIEHTKITEIRKGFFSLNDKLESMINNARLFKNIRGGYHISICGYPNVGKSSLFNCLIGERRAIVTNIKGTTRDVNEAKLMVRGYPITLYDTAGYRQSKDVIEQMGINMAKEVIKKSHIILILDEYNPTERKGITDSIQDIRQKEIIFIKSKCDQKEKNKKGIFKISVKNNIGIQELECEIVNIIKYNMNKIDTDSIMILNDRQEQIIRESNKIIRKIIKELTLKNEMDIIASFCADFIVLFDELFGNITNDDIIKNIFKEFCVGK